MLEFFGSTLPVTRIAGGLVVCAFVLLCICVQIVWTEIRTLSFVNPG